MLLGVDIYSFEQKISHIAKRINLPQPPKLGAGYHRLQGKERIPPLLVINVQLPTYTVRCCCSNMQACSSIEAGAEHDVRPCPADASCLLELSSLRASPGVDVSP